MTRTEILRDRRGRIRCYWHHYEPTGCDVWAVIEQQQATNHSVSEIVPVCEEHRYESKAEIEQRIRSRS